MAEFSSCGRFDNFQKVVKSFNRASLHNTLFHAFAFNDLLYNW